MKATHLFWIALTFAVVGGIGINAVKNGGANLAAVAAILCIMAVVGGTLFSLASSVRTR